MRLRIGLSIYEIGEWFRKSKTMWSGRSMSFSKPSRKPWKINVRVVVDGLDNVRYDILYVYSQTRHSSKPKCWEIVQSLLFLFGFCGAIEGRLSHLKQTHKCAPALSAGDYEKRLAFLCSYHQFFFFHISHSSFRRRVLSFPRNEWNISSRC